MAEHTAIAIPLPFLIKRPQKAQMGCHRKSPQDKRLDDRTTGPGALPSY